MPAFGSSTGAPGDKVRPVIAPLSGRACRNAWNLFWRHCLAERSLWCIVALVSATVASAAMAVGLVLKTQESTTAVESIPRAAAPVLGADLETRPFHCLPLVAGTLPLPIEEVDALCDRLVVSEDRNLSVSFCLHLLHAHGLERQVGSVGTGLDLLAILTDEQSGAAYFPTPPLRISRDGVRLSEVGRRDARDEAHRDQFLAALGQIGIPLSFPLKAHGRAFQVQHLLNDSLANFHLGQEELAWSALAYALYLPPQASWRNRFGESFSFDALADELIRRPLSKESCGGLHLVHALTVLLRANSEWHVVLSENSLSRIRKRLSEYATLAEASQLGNGSWRTNWHSAASKTEGQNGFSNADSVTAAVTVTGHLAEWLLILPHELQVAPDVPLRAAYWLEQQLRNVSEEDLFDNFCPYSHAVYVLRTLASARSSPEVSGNIHSSQKDE